MIKDIKDFESFSTMPDLLVSLYDLPDATPESTSEDVTVRRALSAEKHIACDWIQKHFGSAWAGEAAVSLGRLPVTAWIAIRNKELLGFACYDATAKGFFGPFGVSDTARGQGIGGKLLMAVLVAMREAGYAYAVIGGVGKQRDFYAKYIEVFEIPNSTPGIYRDMLR